MNLSPEDFYRTKDMALATFLKLRGHSFQNVEVEGSTCFWFFRVSDSVMDLVDSYVENLAQVNPKEFSREFNNTKRELIEALEEAKSTAIR